MAGDFDTGGTRFAAVVNENNKCFVKAAAISLALVAAVIALPYIIEAAPVALAGPWPTHNPQAQKYIAYKVTKTAGQGSPEREVRALEPRWARRHDVGRALTPKAHAGA